MAHLRSVAELAGGFGETLGARELARHLGLWHDLGKFHPAFQTYLEECDRPGNDRRRGPDHKLAGVLIAIERGLGGVALPLQGHHGGLRTPEDLKSWLEDAPRRAAAKAALATARDAMPELTSREPLPFPAGVEEDVLVAEMFLRLLFSALVDADFLDTEAHFQPARSDVRADHPSIPELWDRFERNQRLLEGHEPEAPTAVADVRRAIYQACLDAAEDGPGVFRLTAPTGGGKTRSAMAFALRHAMRHGHRRVIVAVPFISITEQTAAVYREIFETDSGSPVVLEHHSGSSFTRDDGEDFAARASWQPLASENWDAPVVVTTTVQLFQSLFSRSTSGVRKLHRLARSVLIIDEAQALPTHVLLPILSALRELSTRYGTTVVLSTATQPTFEAIPAFSQLPAREIVEDPAPLFRALDRVRYDWRVDALSPWADIATLMRSSPQCLAILNTKADALALLDALEDPRALHLSTLLCGAHRHEVITEVARRLKTGQECRLVSTQVVEAGVDLDFPLVLRALGPLDGIIQAAGRCNREGTLEKGRVVVFRPPAERQPAGPYRTATGVTSTILGAGPIDMGEPGLPRRYFEALFARVELDREGIESLRARLDYPGVAARFRMIDDDTYDVVVPHGSPDERAATRRRLETLRWGTPGGRVIRRQLQPYVVSLWRGQAERHVAKGFIAPVSDDLGTWMGRYDAVRGVVAEDSIPDTLVV